MEATAGIEPADEGFADLCLTTWLRRPERLENVESAVNIQRLDAAATAEPAFTS